MNCQIIKKDEIVFILAMSTGPRVHARVGGVLPADPDEEHLRTDGRVDAAAVSLAPVEAVEEASHPREEDDVVGVGERPCLGISDERSRAVVERGGVPYERLRDICLARSPRFSDFAPTASRA